MDEKPGESEPVDLKLVGALELDGQIIGAPADQPGDQLLDAAGPERALDLYIG